MDFAILIFLKPKPYTLLYIYIHTSHTGWEHRLWTDAEVDLLGEDFRNRQAYLDAPNYGQKADILRYELLQTFGGLYVDVDMECLQSFNHLHTLAFYTGFSNTGTVELNNGLIG